MEAIEPGLLCLSEGSERLGYAARAARRSGDEEFAVQLEAAERRLIDLHNELTRTALSTAGKISQLRLAG